ncbi:unnamed protein product [Diamesa hyperborea]
MFLSPFFIFCVCVLLYMFRIQGSSGLFNAVIFTIPKPTTTTTTTTTTTAAQWSTTLLLGLSIIVYISYKSVKLKTLDNMILGSKINSMNVCENNVHIQLHHQMKDQGIYF